MTDRTDSLAQIIQTAVKSALVDTHTSMPGCIVSYNRDLQTCSVQPCIKRRYSTGEVVNLPIIQNVPVQFPGGGEFKMHYDLEKDDDVLIMFSERSIDEWIKKGGTVESTQKRIHDLTDAFVIPGVLPEPKAYSPQGPKGSFEISNGSNSFIISKDGKIKISNDDSELVSVLIELMTEMITGKNLTGVGPLGKDPQYLMKLNEIKTKLEGFKL